MLTNDEILELRTALQNSKRPLFFFDDDPDGVCSFLLFYRFVGEGKGVCVKSSSEVTPDFIRKIDEYGPDAIFILDKPMVSQEFLDSTQTPKYWLDHHPLQKNHNVKYFNPRMHDESDSSPTSYCAYKVVQQDLWIAMTGIVGDWCLPGLKDEFSQQFPDLLDPAIDSPEKALYTSRLGTLVRIFSFNLKGLTSNVNKAVKVMTRLKNPYEVLDASTPQGKFLHKRYESLNGPYEQLLSEVKPTRNKFIFFRYDDQKHSFTADLSNELLFKYPKKIIIIAREKDGEFKCSLRSATKPILPALSKVIEQYPQIRGGGHDMACGAVIPVPLVDKFLVAFRKALG